MVVGILRIVIEVHDSRSLKDKRSVIRSLKSRIESRFKVSVAEVGGLASRQMAELGVACVSNDRHQADAMMGHIADFAVANAGDGYVADIATEIVQLG